MLSFTYVASRKLLTTLPAAINHRPTLIILIDLSDSSHNIRRTFRSPPISSAQPTCQDLLPRTKIIIHHRPGNATPPRNWKPFRKVKAISGSKEPNA